MLSLKTPTEKVSARGIVAVAGGSMEPFPSSAWPEKLSGGAPPPGSPIAAEPLPLRPHHHVAPRARLKRSSWAAIAFLLSLVTALCMLAYVGTELRLLPDAAYSGRTQGNGVLGLGQRHQPPAGLEERDSPLGRPPAPEGFSDSYKFLAVKADGQPLSYSPCRPIHYVINEDLAPEDGRQIIQDAVKRVSEATGLVFIYDGSTDELPSDDRHSYQPGKYGDRWAPVLIAWTSPAVVPRLAGQTIGLGGSSSIGLSSGYRAYVTGTLSLDAAQFRQVLSGWNGRDVGTAVVLHELGHLLGLDHVEDPTQLMYDEASSVHDFADGDLAGLALLGSGPCSKNF